MRIATIVESLMSKNEGRGSKGEGRRSKIESRMSKVELENKLFGLVAYADYIDTVCRQREYGAGGAARTYKPACNIV